MGPIKVPVQNHRLRAGAPFHQWPAARFGPTRDRVRLVVGPAFFLGLPGGGPLEFLPFCISFGLALGHHGLQLVELPAQFAQGGL